MKVITRCGRWTAAAAGPLELVLLEHRLEESFMHFRLRDLHFFVQGISGGVKAAKAGHEVIMTPTSHCYFDYRQSLK